MAEGVRFRPSNSAKVGRCCCAALILGLRSTAALPKLGVSPKVPARNALWPPCRTAPPHGRPVAPICLLNSDFFGIMSFTNNAGACSVRAVRGEPERVRCQSAARRGLPPSGSDEVARGHAMEIAGVLKNGSVKARTPVHAVDWHVRLTPHSFAHIPAYIPNKNH